MKNKPTVEKWEEIAYGLSIKMLEVMRRYSIRKDHLNHAEVTDSQMQTILQSSLQSTARDLLAHSVQEAKAEAVEKFVNKLLSASPVEIDEESKNSISKIHSSTLNTKSLKQEESK